jgi:hypothetical protein
MPSAAAAVTAALRNSTSLQAPAWQPLPQQQQQQHVEPWHEQLLLALGMPANDLHSGAAAAAVKNLPGNVYCASTALATALEAARRAHSTTRILLPDMLHFPLMCSLVEVVLLGNNGTPRDVFTGLDCILTAITQCAKDGSFAAMAAAKAAAASSSSSSAPQTVLSGTAAAAAAAAGVCRQQQPSVNALLGPMLQLFPVVQLAAQQFMQHVKSPVSVPPTSPGDLVDTVMSKLGQCFYWLTGTRYL